MKVYGVIPSRLKASRFPNKPLAQIAGKSMIQRVVENSLKAKKLAGLIVATDSEEIKNELRSLPVDVVMTDSDLPSGTDRVYAAIKHIETDAVINIQGDEPLIHPEVIDQLVDSFTQYPGIDMVTMGQEITHLEDLISFHLVKVICNKQQEAIYFSRFAIPYSRVNHNQLKFPLKGCLKHIGLYGYTFSFLKQLCHTAPVELELGESLEQLRAIYLGAKIKVIKTNHFFLGVDVPEDIQKVEKWLDSFHGKN
ncbi:MAG: 3-deoxy-manno-octulosonate cytidylyltransferase [Bdellovibrionaceae bacterium]|nr:3-deoxy-manno-octulosonate cytidylyltransferase [Pseudobdellovibrionaceae bacterium]NUM60346.1 3-deoxy-manno-octulosonate cytidylyltransferase [Pseudobdellovibrionaceae bacterium]